MSYEDRVVEVLYVGNHKYEIVKSTSTLITDATFSIYRDGEYHRGSFASLERAVEAVHEE
jgi:hypothetical protein